MRERPNLEYIKKLAGDDSAFEARFIGILKMEFPEEQLEYLDNIKNKRPRAAEQNVHKLKHKLNILGLEKAYNFALEYEEELHDGNAHRHSIFVKVLETIEIYLKTI